ncbi:MAG: Mfa1 fimbrilin C-terminal domain-containing protein, partial [Alistipes sp.]|nr:Mfa1 fimbrilin C-terminal domain-containing protein [Alistipes sp.]
AVLVSNTYKGVYPSQIVAVINWIPTENTYTLADLHEELATLGNDTNGYVMSNSVYMDKAGNMIDAVPLTAANIKTTETEALAAPVEIYVERIAAKVVLTASKGTVVDNAIYFDTQNNSSALTPAGESLSDVDVYVKLNGWELYNDYATSNLLKNIDNWDTDVLGLTWNDSPYFRCYWAESQDTPLNDKFAWSYQDGENINYGHAVGAYTYCGENTWPVTIDSEGKVIPHANNTKVVLKGQLMQKDGEGYKPLELARWYGTEYAGNEALRIAVANSLKYTLFSSADGATFTSIKPEDLQCVAGKDVDPNVASYKVGFQLSTTDGNGVNKTWYLYNSESGYVAFGDPGITGDNAAKANTHLATLEPALLYANGMTYYTVDIEHLGTKEAKYGVVRNHVYQVDIRSIKGYGSPVYDGLNFVVEKPEYPEEDESSYVAARINILSWKIVKQGVDIIQ